MASKNTVTLTFAGDSDQLEKTFSSVGDSADKMSKEVGSASKRVGTETKAGFDRAAEGADNVDTKAMGFRDTLTGVQDTMRGTAMLAKGPSFEGFVTLGMGIGDSASGMFNFIIPALKATSLSMIRNAVSTTRATVAMGAHRVATIASTVAQRALNLAMRANPIGLVITVLFALGAALVAAWKRSETFRNIVKGTWAAVLNGAKAMGRGIAAVARLITAPYIAAFRGIRAAWNATIGGKGFSIPKIGPFGGFSMRIPRLHSGGVVPGSPGSETLALLQAGERVTPAGRSSGIVIEINSSGAKLDDWLLEIVRKSVRVRGGNVQLVLGR